MSARYNLKEVSMAEKDKSEKDRDEIESFGQLSLSEKDDESIKLITIIGGYVYRYFQQDDQGLQEALELRR